MSGRIQKEGHRPRRPPAEKIELSNSHFMGRVAAAVILLAVGAAFLAWSVGRFFSSGAGWQEIAVDSGGTPDSGGDYSLVYELGAAGIGADREGRDLRAVYSEAARTAYQVFSNDTEYVWDGGAGEDAEAEEGKYAGGDAVEGRVGNLRYLNDHVNQVVSVDAGLYRAFQTAQEAGSRALYLAPIDRFYQNLFACTEDSQAAEYDPVSNPSVGAFFAEAAAFAREEGAVCLELLGDNQVRLNVSEKYLEFAQREGIRDFVDFSWMRNAFIADYLAETLTGAGYTHGALSSVDGFVRNLADRETSLALPFYVWRLGDGPLTAAGKLAAAEPQGQNPLGAGKSVRAATMEYRGPMSIVSLRSFSTGPEDARRLYTFQDGSLRVPYLDIRDGAPKAALNGLTAYGQGTGCAGILLRMIPVYVADAFSEQGLEPLHREGIHTIYCQDGAVRYDQQGLVLTDFYEGEDGTAYTAEP